MENNKIAGIKGESLAKNYFESKGYKIIETNYKNKLGEIDLIVKQGDAVVFVEVKYRESLKFGHPREAVNFYKQQKIRKVATLYLQSKRLIDKALVRFDVVDVLGEKITHIENAF